jgi:hypothetical protein
MRIFLTFNRLNCTIKYLEIFDAKRYYTYMCLTNNGTLGRVSDEVG